MRRLDGADDHLPVVRRFRDRHFGPGHALQRHDADALQAVRTRLRAVVAALHMRLSNLSDVSDVSHATALQAAE